MRTILSAVLLIQSNFAWAQGSNSAPCPRLLISQTVRTSAPTPSQRLLVQSLELKRLKPFVETPVHFIDAREVVNEQSQANRDRLISSIPMPSAQNVRSEESRRIAELVKSLQFIGLTSYSDQQDGAAILPQPDLYSHLVSGAKSVGLEIFATHEPKNIQSLRGRVLSDKARVGVPMMREFGLVLPNFKFPISLIGFMQRHEPQAVTQTVKLNRFNLPISIRSSEDMIRYVNTTRVDQVFPEHALYGRMAPLREELYKYAMTVPDAEIFFRHAVTVYLTRQLDQGNYTLQSLEKIWATPGGSGAVFDAALQAVGWSEGASVKIPLNLPNYSIIRYSEVNPQADNLLQKRALDSRRLDHKQMP